MAERADILRRVMGLLAVANDPRSNVGERSNAALLADRLCVKYGISEVERNGPTPDLTAALEEQLGSMFGGFTEEGRAHRAEVKAKIAAVEEAIDQLAVWAGMFGPTARATILSKAFTDLRHKVEGWSAMNQGGFRQHRDEAVTDMFEAEFAKEKVRSAGYGGSVRSARNSAIHTVRYRTELPRDADVERIVEDVQARRRANLPTKEARDAAYEEAKRERVCAVCNLDANEDPDHEIAAIFEFPAKGNGKKKRHPMHESCYRKLLDKSDNGVWPKGVKVFR